MAIVLNGRTRSGDCENTPFLYRRHMNTTERPTFQFDRSADGFDVRRPAETFAEARSLEGPAKKFLGHPRRLVSDP